MDKAFMAKVLENVFFVATEPVTMGQLKETFQIESPEGLAGLEVALVDLKKEYESRGLQLIEVGGGYLLTTQKTYGKWIQRYKTNAPAQLTEEGRVTLAIIAYKQPIKRNEIEVIRGVDCESVLQTLRAYGLVTVAGELAGAHLYCTTKKFLTLYGLNQLSDLPPLAKSLG